MSLENKEDRLSFMRCSVTSMSRMETQMEHMERLQKDLACSHGSRRAERVAPSSAEGHRLQVKSAALHQSGGWQLSKKTIL